MKSFILLISYLDNIWSESLTEKNEIITAKDVKDAIAQIHKKYGDKKKLVIRSIYCEWIKFNTKQKLECLVMIPNIFYIWYKIKIH